MKAEYNSHDPAGRNSSSLRLKESLAPAAIAAGSGSGTPAVCALDAANPTFFFRLRSP